MSKIITPVVTILDKDEKIDLQGNDVIIEHLLAGGVDGILVLGSTGEFTTLSYDEKAEFFAYYAEKVAGRAELYAGVNCPNLRDTIRLAHEALRLGYHGVLDTGPYYFAMDEETIFNYYDALLKAVPSNVYIYNFPDRTGHTIAPATVKKLRDEHPNLRGMKDSVQTPGHTRDVCFAVDRPDFEMYSGFDDQYLANLAAGGWGCISALSNLVPGIWSDLVRTQDAGDGPRSMELFRLITRLMQLYAVDTNFTKVFKRLLKDQGLPIQDFCVFPTRDLDEAKYAAGLRLLRDTLAEYEGL